MAYPPGVTDDLPSKPGRWAASALVLDAFAIGCVLVAPWAGDDFDTDLNATAYYTLAGLIPPVSLGLALYCSSRAIKGALNFRAKLLAWVCAAVTSLLLLAAVAFALLIYGYSGG